MHNISLSLKKKIYPWDKGKCEHLKKISLHLPTSAIQAMQFYI